MVRDEWARRWDDGRIAFHQPSVSPLLQKYAAHVLGADSWGRVYVPLCGKSLDMVFLAERSTEVLGVEFVEQAVREYFDSQALDPDVDDTPPIRYRAGPYTLFVADFFSVTSEHLGHIDSVLDRAALIALDRETRIRYAHHLSSLLQPGARVLLITLDYDESHMSGPPFAVSATEVHELFEGDFEIAHLESRNALDDGFRARGLSAMTESAFGLTKR